MNCTEGTPCKWGLNSLDPRWWQCVSRNIRDAPSLILALQAEQTLNIECPEFFHRSLFSRKTINSKNRNTNSYLKICQLVTGHIFFKDYSKKWVRTLSCILHRHRSRERAKKTSRELALIQGHFLVTGRNRLHYHKIHLRLASNSK